MSESRAGGYRRLFLVVVFALAVYVLVRAAHTPQGHSPPPAGKTLPTPTASAGSPTPSASPSPASYDPATYAGQVRARARQTGVSAQLLMAILYNEAYKPHDPAFERAWQKFKPDAAFGIANMHRATFDEVRQGRDFADRNWQDLPDDRGLAVEAEAWYVHDLATRLPAHWSAPYTEDALLALGYDAGPGNMLAFARGASLGGDARSYLDRLHGNWAKAKAAVGS